MPSAINYDDDQHVFPISPSWEFTRTRDKSGTTFAFHSDGQRRGYSVRVSNWRLRKATSSPSSSPADIMGLHIEADAELVRVLGDDAFKRSRVVMERIQNLVEAIEHTLERSEERKEILLPRLRIRHDDQTEQISAPPKTPEISEKHDLEKLNREYQVARFMDMFDPRVALYFIPIHSLIMRDRVPYVFENTPWPFEAPPRMLRHLGDLGFSSRAGYGITALPPSGEDTWIVSAFSECEVEAKWDRAAALKTVSSLKDVVSRHMAQNDRQYAAILARTEAIARNDYELRQENTELRDLANEGFLRFATRIKADDFRAFAAIMLAGTKNKAAKELEIPHRSFYDRVESWLSRGSDYRRMHMLVDWRKKVGRKIIVPLGDSLLGTETGNHADNPATIREILDAMRDQADGNDRDAFFRDILQAIASQNAQNWQSIQSELIGLLRERI